MNAVQSNTGNMFNVADISMSVALFPNKLYRMLSDTQCHSLYWGVSGDHLVINTRDFEDELLQNTAARWRYQLKTTSTTSFIRQLHAYGFRKVIEGFCLERPAEPNHIRRYYHPYFHRDRMDLLVFMKRSVRTSTRRPISSSAMAQVAGPALLNRHLMTGLPGYRQDRAMFTEFRPRPPPVFMSKRRRKTQPMRHPSFDNKRYKTETEPSVQFTDDSSTSITAKLEQEMKKHLESYRNSSNPNCSVSDKTHKFNLPVKAEAIDVVGFPKPKQPKISDPEPKISEKLPEKQKSPKKEEEPQNRMFTRSRIKNMAVASPEKKEETDEEEETSESDEESSDDESEEEESETEESEDKDINVTRSDDVTSQTGDVIVTRSCDVSNKSNDTSSTPHKTISKLTNITRKLSDVITKPHDATTRSNDVTIKPNDVMDQQETKERDHPKVIRPTPLMPTNPHMFRDYHTNPKHPPSFYPCQPLTIAPQQPRFTSPGNFPAFPNMGNPPVTVPPYSVLQPAYIAWPTRKAYCSRTKQWMHPRPTIIPLSYNRPPSNTMSTSPNKSGPQEQQGSFPFYPPWGPMIKDEPPYPYHMMHEHNFNPMPHENKDKK